MRTREKVMKDTQRQVLIWDIVEKDLPNTIGITANEYFNAGWEYESGLYVHEVNLDLAVKCYEKAVALGHVKAMNALAKLYERNDDPENAYRWYLEAALAEEDAEAITEIGEMYLEGDFLRSDTARAYQCFQVAYEKGEAKAMYYLGYFAEEGLLEAPDLKKAHKYYREGSAKYEKRCMEKIAKLESEEEECHGNV